MSSDVVIQLGQNALFMVMLISAPMLGLGLMVGLMISIFQATTQINEQTLVFIPKIAAVFIAVLIFGPWMLRLMIGYMRELIINIPRMLG